MKSSLEVTDLFKGAFLLCMGGRLDAVRVRQNGRRIATFVISGADLDRMDTDYRAGRALVNPVQLRESLNHLRDVMFDQLRRHARAMQEAAPWREGRARDEHRKRDHRTGQTY